VDYWTEKEEKYLEKHFSKKSYGALSEELGRSINGVKRKAQRLGLRLSEEEVSRRISEVKKKLIGSKNPNWKGGISKERYRYVIQQRERFPQKNKARMIVSQAVRRGSLKQQPCEVCGEGKAHAHHPDYSKPFDVIWLCPKHHREEHQRILTREQVALNKSRIK